MTNITKDFLYTVKQTLAERQAREDAELRIISEALNEHAEELDEISGKTLGSYIQKNRADQKSRRGKMDDIEKYPDVKKIESKADELWNKARGSYGKTAERNFNKWHEKRGEAEAKKDEYGYSKLASKNNSRRDQLDKAVKKLTSGKLTNEDVDFDMEILENLLQKYNLKVVEESKE